MARMNQFNLAEDEAAKIKEEILHKEGENLRKKRKKISNFDFDLLNIIGKEAFGEIRVFKYIPNVSIVAIKKMKKEKMHKKNHVLHVRSKRDVLSGAKNEWIVDLKFLFQRMEFLRGRFNLSFKYFTRTRSKILSRRNSFSNRICS